MIAQAQAHSFGRGMPRLQAALTQVTSLKPPEILEGNGCVSATWLRDGRRLTFMCMIESSIAFLAIEENGEKRGEPPVSIPRFQAWIRWVEGGEKPEGDWKTCVNRSEQQGE